MNQSQFVTLHSLITHVNELLSPQKKPIIYGHRDLDKNGKTCPNFDVNLILDLAYTKDYYQYAKDNWKLQTEISG